MSKIVSIFRYCKIILTYEDIPSEMLVSQHLAISLIMLIDGKHFLFNKFSKSFDLFWEALDFPRQIFKYLVLHYSNVIRQDRYATVGFFQLFVVYLSVNSCKLP